MSPIFQFLNLLKIYDTKFNKVRIGPKFDGGYILLDEFIKKKNSLISLGVGNDVAFDLDFLRKNNCSKAYLFDKTSDIKLPKKRLFFYKKNVSSFSNAKDKVIGINSLLKRFKKRIILKMDIEGNEWHILQKIDKSNLSKISQMVIEFHLIHIDINKKVLSEKYTPYFTKFYKNNYNSINRDLFQKYFEIIKKLNKYFYIFHIHPNNSIKKINIENFSIPPLLEISFINKNCVRSVRISESKFPIKNLDFPNKIDRSDIKNFYPFIKNEKKYK